eukprot:CAMPEP_0119115278 /NCGR_PEP_ID=MMETSP1180-20130426/50436_1 /TAXON_ID=3052 ORGANISM="Chlamydomonas cf sp, Strain CCMP681" /NCGR_SAMPLE_ID=MMETSP1180 /ASSEMBLY_ACC=CAM_ASM_000741 /LENGTH=315 /DNA_ID=CAMNT_0007104183 /DNA_START=70 /DNA_END=1017 /DNA_ORIENTATION=+
MGKHAHSSSDSDTETEQKKDKKGKKDKKSKEHKKGKEKKDKQKHKHKKHKRSHGSSSEEDDMVKKAKSFLKAQLAQGADILAVAGFVAPPPASTSAALMQPVGPPVAATLPKDKQLSQQDFALRIAEFSLWLVEERGGLLFADLEKPVAAHLFDYFCQLYNAEKLAAKYYTPGGVANVRRTAHVWNIKGAADSTRERAENKARLEELVPREAAGQDRRAAERIGRRDLAKGRDASPDAVRLPGGGDVFGGDDDFQTAKAREAARLTAGDRNRQRRAEANRPSAAAVTAFQAKEDEKMAQFRALVSQGPITISKRQ